MKWLAIVAPVLSLVAGPSFSKVRLEGKEQKRALLQPRDPVAPRDPITPSSYLEDASRALSDMIPNMKKLVAKQTEEKDKEQNGNLLKIMKAVSDDEFVAGQIKKERDALQPMIDGNKHRMTSAQNVMRETEREITKEWRELSFDVIKDINDKKDETTVEYKKAKEKVKEGYEAVAALLKYQEAEFVKLKDTSNKTHTKLNTAMEEAEKPVSDIIQETKHNLDNVIATAGIKYDELEAKTDKEMKEAKATAKDSLTSVQDYVTQEQARVNDAVSAEKQRVTVVERGQQKLLDFLTSSNAGLELKYQNVQNQGKLDSEKMLASLKDTEADVLQRTKVKTDGIVDKLRAAGLEQVNKLLEAERSGKKGLASAEDRAAALFGALQNEEKERDAELQGSLGDLAGLNTEAAEAMGEAKAGMTGMLTGIEGKAGAMAKEVLEGNKANADASAAEKAKFAEQLKGEVASMQERIKELESAGNDALSLEEQQELTRLRSSVKAKQQNLSDLNDELKDMGDETSEYATDSGDAFSEFSGIIGDFKQGFISSDELWEQVVKKKREQLKADSEGNQEALENEDKQMKEFLKNFKGKFGELIVEAETGFDAAAKTQEEANGAKIGAAAKGVDAEAAKFGSQLAAASQANAAGQSSASAGAAGAAGQISEVGAAEARLASGQLAFEREIQLANREMAQSADATEENFQSRSAGAGSGSSQRFAQKSAASNSKAVANVDGDLMSTAMQTEGQVGTVGMAEEAMQSGMKRLAADSAALQTSLSSVRDASAKVNADINEEFAGVISSLATDKIEQYQTEEQLRGSFDSQKQKLNELFEQRISQMSAEDQGKYNALVKNQMEELERTMNNPLLSMEEKKKALAETNADIAKALTDLNMEALISEDELKDVQRNMRRTGDTVGRAVDNAYNELGVEQLMLQESAEDQRAALEERMAKVKKSVEAAGPKLEGEYGAQVDVVLQESNAAIQQILNAEHLDDAAKQREIEKIDQRTQSRLKELAKLQVAAESDLASYETLQKDADKETSDRIGGAEISTKEAAERYMQQIQKERKLLYSQTDDLTSIVQGVLSMIEEENKGSVAALSEEQHSAKLELEKMLLNMDAEAEEKKAQAEQALNTARSASDSSTQMKSVARAQLSLMESKLTALANGVGDRNQNLKQRIADETQARKRAVANQKQYLAESTGSVVEQLDTVSAVVALAAETSLKKQEELSERTMALVQSMTSAANGENAAGQSTLVQIDEKTRQMHNQTAQVAALRVELAQYKRFAERMQANLAAEAALLEARNSTAAAETRRGEEAVALAIAAEQRRELGAATAAAHGLAEDGTRAAAQLKAFVQAAEADQARQNVSSAAQAEDFDKRVTRWAEDVESTDGGAERAAAAALARARRADAQLEAVERDAEARVGAHSQAYLDLLARVNAAASAGVPPSAPSARR